MSRLPVIVVLWFVFVLTLARALYKDQLLHRAGQRTWLMFFLSILACTFWGEAAEMSLDRHFDDLPVALYLKYVSLIGVCHLYRQLLRDVGGLSGTSPLLDYLAPTAIGLGVLSFIGFAWLAPIPRDDLRYIVIGTRDAVILLYILTGFYRGTLAMWQREQVLAMRLKQASIILFFSFFAISTVGSITAAVLTVLQIGDPARAARILQPFLYPAIFFFILMLIPYRWYAALPHYQSLWRYYQLKQLEQRILQLAQSEPNPDPLPWVILHAERLELAIYRTVISILDVYPMLPDTTDARLLANTIKESLMNHPDYTDLIVALARCADVRSDS